MVRIIKKEALRWVGDENGLHAAPSGGSGSFGSENAYESKFFAILDKRLSELDSLAEEIQQDLIWTPTGEGDSRPRILTLCVSVNAMTLEILKMTQEAKAEKMVDRIIKEEFGKGFPGIGTKLIK